MKEGARMKDATSEMLRMRQNTTERRQQGPLKSIGYQEHIIHVIDNSSKYRSNQSNKPEQSTKDS